ncbi:MAG: Fis family transcriptional regulator [Gammaproteobacteria bacterium]|jgi:Fis family transcriptional regulator|nr:Fis family transcriptional regulator [Gammaproteobacteria bacterium]
MENKQVNFSAPALMPVTLRENITQIMKHYFSNLKGEETQHIYDFFLEEVEEPLLTAVMRYTDNNQSEAARLLNISRGTLRSKLKKYGLL